jgi:hypothetical protein
MATSPNAFPPNSDIESTSAGKQVGRAIYPITASFRIRPADQVDAKPVQVNNNVFRSID